MVIKWYPPMGMVYGADHQMSQAFMSGDQVANLLPGNHVEFDNQEGDLLTLSNLPGQGSGQITLAPGFRYQLQAALSIAAIAANNISYQWYNVTDASFIGVQGSQQTGALLNSIGGPIASSVIIPAQETIVELRIVTIAVVTSILAAGSYALVAASR